MLIKSRKDYTWDGVDILHYKQEPGTHFDKITRQVLFGGRDDLEAELRYFQLEPGGYSTLEKHRHVHCVLIIRGTGECLAEGKVESVSAFDLVEIPPGSWHQFQASGPDPMGFICMVSSVRDSPVRPSPQDLEELASDPEVGAFIRH